MNLKSLWTGLPRAARVYLGVVGGVAVAVVAVTVTALASGTPLLAASPSPSPSGGAGTGQAYCNRYVGHVASNLGKTTDQVRKALADALNQTLDDAVKNGDLTQKQADAIKARAGSGGQVCQAGGLGRLGGLPGLREGFGRGGRIGLDEIASALGISSSELQQDLQSGKTVQQIAASKGMDETAFRNKLASVVRSDLDKQVAAGNLTQNQENEILQRIQSGTPPFWNGAPRRPFGPRGPGGQPPAPPSPSGSTA